MKVIDKLIKRCENMEENDPVTIAFLGDSVTQGCFELFSTGEDTFDTVFDPECSYANLVRKILLYLYPQAQINIINAGISGGNTCSALKRIDRDVLKFSPDLTVVCLGTNDSVDGFDGLNVYLNNLKQIFQKIIETKSEIIFLVPHMINDHINPKLTNKNILTHAMRNEKFVKDGVIDAYYDSAKKLAREMRITICDCYSIWKKLQKSGVDITELLSNQLNHPTREMHWVFAYELVKCIMD